MIQTLGLLHFEDAAEIRDHETGLVSGPFSWFQSRQLFHETHETEEPYVFSILPSFKILNKTPSIKFEQKH